MIKQQVEVIVLAADFEPVLLAEEGEPGPQLDEELTDMGEEPLLDGLLLGLLGKREELELVRILERLPGEVRLGPGQGPLEIRLGLALALVKAALDPLDQDVSAPAV